MDFPGVSLQTLRSKRETFSIEIRKRTRELEFAKKRTQCRTEQEESSPRQFMILEEGQSLSAANTNDILQIFVVRRVQIILGQHKLSNVIPALVVRAIRLNNLEQLKQSILEMNSAIEQIALMVNKKKVDQEFAKECQAQMAHFYLSNQDLVEIVLSLIQFQKMGLNEFQQGICEAQFQLCQTCLHILINLSYFDSPEIINDLFDREIVSRVLLPILQQLQRKQVFTNNIKTWSDIILCRCINIFFKMIEFFTNLLLDPSVAESKQLEMKQEILDSPLFHILKWMQDEVEDKSSMIPFLYSLIKKPSPEIKEKSKLTLSFVGIVVPFVQRTNDQSNMYYLECLYILVFLSQQSTSVTSLTTKSIWEKLLTDRRNYNYTFQFFANILRNEDAPTCETLHHMGILEKLEDFNERNEHDEKFPLTLQHLQKYAILVEALLAFPKDAMLDYATRKAIPLISESCQLLLYDDIILIEELAIIISNIIQHQFPTFANYTQIFDASSIETLAKGYIVNTSSLLERLAKHHSLFKVIVETLLQFNDTPKNVVYSLYQRIQISQLPSILNMVFEASKEEELIEILTDFADKLQDWEKDAIQIDESQI